jgi:hypothetical protein
MSKRRDYQLGVVFFCLAVLAAFALALAVLWIYGYGGIDAR